MKRFSADSVCVPLLLVGLAGCASSKHTTTTSSSQPTGSSSGYSSETYGPSSGYSSTSATTYGYSNTGYTPTQYPPPGYSTYTYSTYQPTYQPGYNTVPTKTTHLSASGYSPFYNADQDIYKPSTTPGMDVLADEGEIYRPSEYRARPTPTATTYAATSTSTTAPAETSSNKVMGTTETRSSSSSGMKSLGSLAVPTGQRSTSTILLETFGPGEAIAGKPFDYEMRVTNLTDMELHDVVVNDVLPASIKVNSSDPKAQVSVRGDTAWAIGDLAAHDTRTIRLNVTAAEQGSVGLCASVTYNAGLCSAINVVKPMLKLTASGPSQQVSACDTIPVRMVVSNQGSGTARNVRIKQALPAGVTTAEGSTTLDYDAGTLGPGESKEVTVNLKPTRSGRFDAQPQAVADDGLQSEAVPISFDIGAPKLTIEQHAPDHAFVGRPMSREIVISNTGNAAARNVVVDCQMPSGTSFASATEGGKAGTSSVTWNLGTIEPGQSRTISTMLNGDVAGSLTSVATVKSDCAEMASASATTALTGVPGLLLQEEDNPDPVLVGQDVVYTVSVINQGSIPLTNVKLTCAIEADTMQWDGITGQTDGTPSGQTVTFRPISSLAPKATATYKITVKAMKEGQVQFRAEASSDEITRPLSKVETTNFYK